MSNYTYLQYIDGNWAQASNGSTWDVVNPATEEVIRTVPFGSAEDCNAAIEAAARAFKDWAFNKTPYERGAILKKAADIMRERLDALGRTATMESGKPFREARGEWGVTADLFEWYAEEGKRAYGRVIPSRQINKRRIVIKQPLGVVGVITAWNFPSYNPGRAVAAALGAGCTVVLRASEFTPLTAMEMVNILVEAGIPKGVVNLINGEPEAQGQAMLDHPTLRKISFTGSTRVGRILLDGASRNFTRLGLELGGNAPVLIFPDVDLEALAKTAVTARFRNNGQVCISPQRFLVHTRVLEEFLDRTTGLISALKVGNGLDESSDVGPLINARQRDRVEQMMAQAVQEGVQVLAGGGRPADLNRGYFYQPTLIANVTMAHDIARQEIFGPVLPVIPFTEPEEALDIANATEYGLAAYLFTNDLNTAIKMYEGLEFGMVGVNDWAPQTTEAPFGGWKQSGQGHEAGQEGLEDYMETKVVAFGVT
ncbi:MAG: NAD-dependent succinate-semialdehyde dehydrogenase [Anaerolineae bacterium]|nr:NAD-dependent succinate-semialdehyde dehydrogenase [Anaerolineae bacterium]